jgi:hypothetical protein
VEIYLREPLIGHWGARASIGDLMLGAISTATVANTLQMYATERMIENIRFRDKDSILSRNCSRPTAREPVTMATGRQSWSPIEYITPTVAIATKLGALYTVIYHR